ncbi:PIN domain-like protein [Obba rivulosa]|uniref:PIN domain-like protein n=1 Tax=Obba rivulosa TaxID=1052685 RepID=A0A8E2AU12_9APHY|nr:PIN domain-like protein [Obba rivulosa]
MGIHGLTTYLRENKRALARTLVFQAPKGLGEVKRTPVVVDGWSFIYEILARADLPWVYGGEYDTFSAVIVQTVDALIDAGINLYFVFDGPYPSLKFPTLISRMTQTGIQGGLLFFRTSAAARSTPRFLHEMALLPPLVYDVCVRALQALISDPSLRYTGRLEIHFADEEGDPFAVALAGRLGAYVLGRDSDFVVLNTEGYKGYIPLEEVVWTGISGPTSPDASIYSSLSKDVDGDEDEDGFRRVRKPKARKRAEVDRRLGSGIIPPDSTDDTLSDLTLTCEVYTPAALADHLELPASVLPLLGALVGNDYTGASEDTSPSGSPQRSSSRKGRLQHLFFERRLTLQERITHVASTLRSILAETIASSTPTIGKRRRRRQIGSVMELIDAAVTALLIRPPDTMASGEREAIVDRIVEATLQYALPRVEELDESVDESSIGTTEDGSTLWASDVCVLHTPESCPLYAYLYRRTSSDAQPPSADYDDFAEPDDPEAHIRALYISAYRRGALNPRILNAVNTASSWPRLFLEDPDKESVSRSIGRPIREWGYALLGAGVQPPEAEQESEGAEGEDEDKDDDDDELVDVQESDEDEDFLAPLRGALQRLDVNANGDHMQPLPSVVSAVDAAKPPAPKVIVEYVRRGTRLAAEEVLVPSLSDMSSKFSYTSTQPMPPVQLLPEEDRITYFLRALESDVAPVRALPPEMLMAVLAVRWVVRSLWLRARENASSKERVKERWTREEARAFLSAFTASAASTGRLDTSVANVEELPTIPVEDRNVQLMAQINAAIEEIDGFAQILLLTDRVPNPISRFSGKRFHGYLTGVLQGAGERLPPAVWEACLYGQEEAFAEPVKSRRKERKAAAPSPLSPAKRGGTRGAVQKGLYDLLGDATI